MRTWLFCLTVVILAASATIAFAQPAVISAPKFDGDYLARLERAERALASLTPDASVMAKDFAEQELAFARMLVGVEADKLRDIEFQSMLPPGADELKSLDAISSIRLAAKNKQIVILNEGHDRPRHRAFAAMLAKALREDGFDTFACEGLSPTVDYSSRTYPTVGMGYYVIEPYYGDLIRQAMSLGYRLVSYEKRFTDSDLLINDPFVRMDNREAAQAANLKSLIFERDSKARVFIYAGYMHASKRASEIGPKRQPMRWLAGRLKDEMGIDPLSIDQTEVERPRQHVLGSLKAHLAGSEARDVVLFDPKAEQWTVFGLYRGLVDMQVLHLGDGTSFDRPSWTTMNGYRVPVDIPSAIIAGRNERFLVQAFAESEGKDAIPLDQVLIVPGQKTIPRLMLPEGIPYRISTLPRSRLTSVDVVGQKDR